MSGYWFAIVPCPHPACVGLVRVTGRYGDPDRNCAPCCDCGTGDWSDDERKQLERYADTHRESPDPRAYDGPDTIKELA